MLLSLGKKFTLKETFTGAKKYVTEWDCKKCIGICSCSCRSIVSSVSAPIKIFV